MIPQFGIYILKIILLKEHAGKNGTVCFSGRRVIVLATLLAIVSPIALGLLTYWVAATIDRSMNPFVDKNYRLAVETRVEEQQQQVANTREYVRKHIDVLGQKIGSLQAQVSRIHAVEMRIADSAGIKLDDFSFEQDPPVGGSAKGISTEQIDIENAIAEIEKELLKRESEIATVDFLLSSRNLKNKQTPSGWPVKNGWISSSFGNRMHPITGKKQFHRGVDIPGKLNSDVKAVADGVVTRSTKRPRYGWLVEVDHGDGYSTIYGHNSKNLVIEGETVKKGQAIAKLGNTGRSTGPHVHFEVLLNGRNINPVKYLSKKL